MGDVDYEAGKLVGCSGEAPKPRLVSEGGEPVPSPLAACDSTSSPESCRGEPSPDFEMIDRVARGICMAENDDPCGSVYAMIDESARNGYRHMAKAAILVMNGNRE